MIRARALGRLALTVPLVRALAAATVVVVVATAVHAMPASAEPTREEADKAVTALSHRMELATEQYNEARSRLATSREKVAALEPRARQLRSQLDLYEAKLGRIATDAYSGATPDVMMLMLASRSPQEFLDQAAFLDHISAHQRAEIQGLLDTKKSFDAAKAKVDAELVEQARQEKVLRDKRSVINKDLGKWQSLAKKLARKNTFTISDYDGPATGRAAAALEFAFAQQGKMYEWGAAGPSRYDCSGLTMAAWGHAGVSMPHTARGQYAMFPRVSLSELRPGDLVMYGSPIHHVAMYVGNGKIIHASTYGQPVAVRPIRYGNSPITGAVRPS